MSMDNAPSKNWELTLYELHRKPQEPITDGTEIAVSPRSLKSELMCPICLDILKVTMTTKECLHRFCSECIVTALRSGNKECPTCRKKLVSKRSLRRDPNFDALIAKIYPSREEYEAHQDKILAKLNRQHLSAALTRSIEQQLGLSANRGSSGRGYPNGRLGNSSSFITGAINASGDGVGDSGMNDDDMLATRRVSHGNSDTESGVETNSVGGASSLSASDAPSRGTVTSTLGANSAGTGDSAANPNTNHSLAAVNRIQDGLMGVNSASSPAVYPEIELLLKPHPLFCGFTSQRPASPSNNNNSTRNGESGGTNGPVKYLKAPTITTVDHLCRYLSVRVNLQRMHREVSDDRVGFALYSYNESTNTFTRLGSHLSLEEISRNSFHGTSCLDLYYSRDTVPISGSPPPTSSV
ncbi:unnamed protein product [Calicophoron daubneyi]|uniref:RING-type E3 ubiquitin transferase n=1 Tax=Calicophoron daubneyi TaxID=300641 RepID=A0AAV2TX36_CALDB